MIGVWGSKTIKEVKSALLCKFKKTENGFYNYVKEERACP